MRSSAPFERIYVEKQAFQSFQQYFHWLPIDPYVREGYGDIQRTYPQIDPEVFALPELSKLLSNFEEELCQ